MVRGAVDLLGGALLMNMLRCHCVYPNVGHVGEDIMSLPL